MSLDFYVPLLTYPDPTPAAGIAAVVEFAAAVGGRLHVSSHVVDIPPIINPLAPAAAAYAGIATEVQKGSAETAAGLSEEARRQIVARRLTSMLDSFQTRPDALGDHLATAARSHDAAVFAHDPESVNHRAAAEALLFGSGGPVVLLPVEEDHIRLEKVAVAWDGGRAAARAVRDSLPLLQIAGRVTVLTAGDEKAIDATSLAGLLAHLGGHGIETEHREFGTAHGSVGDAIQEEAMECGADLLVMGAYGRNRLREFVLGGATRSVLMGLSLPTLMSH